MFRKMLLSAALLVLSGCASMGRPDSGVRQGMASFQDAFNKRDAASLAMVYTEDARLMPYNAPMLASRLGI
jgi:ketosteroid isomerase-like protein